MLIICTNRFHPRMYCMPYMPGLLSAHRRDDFRINSARLGNGYSGAWSSACLGVTVASDTDRRLVLAFQVLSLQLGRSDVFRFYIGENGFVREFRTPQLVDAWDACTRVGRPIS